MTHSRPLVQANPDLLVCIEKLHRQTRLSGMIPIRPVVAGSVTPPSKVPVQKIGLARVKHRIAIRNHRMPVSRMHQHFAVRAGDEHVFHVRQNLSQCIAALQSILPKEADQLSNLRTVHLPDRSGIQILVEPVRDLHLNIPILNASHQNSNGIFNKC